MIQRIQSVYLLLGALCMASLSLIDSIWQSQAAAALSWYVPVIAIVGAIGAIMAVVAIFLYKDRQKQRKAILALQMITIGFIVVLVGGLFLAGDFETTGTGGIDPAALPALLLPVLAYAFFYLARRGVQRDIDLIKSMDRLR